MDNKKFNLKTTVPTWAKACWSGQPPHDKLKLLAPSGRYRELNASLHLRDPEYGYVRGFHVAAQILAGHVIKTRRDLDILAFPIVYSYRHHVELILKRLVRKGARLANVRLTDQDKKWLGKHRLDKLWEILLPIVSNVAPLPSEAKEGIRACVSQLNLFDPEGQGSRYHLSSKGGTSLDKSSHVNVRVFAERMEWLSCQLEGIDCRFDDKEELMNLTAKDPPYLE